MTYEQDLRKKIEELEQDKINYPFATRTRVRERNLKLLKAELRGFEKGKEEKNHPKCNHGNPTNLITCKECLFEMEKELRNKAKKEQLNKCIEDVEELGEKLKGSWNGVIPDSIVILIKKWKSQIDSGEKK